MIATEIEAFEAIKMFLLENGNHVENEVHQPNGPQKFPDFSVKIDDRKVYFEITHNQLEEGIDFAKGESRIRKLQTFIENWLPSGYSLFIVISGSIISRGRGKRNFSSRLSDYLECHFKSGKLSFSESDFSEFSSKDGVKICKIHIKQDSNSCRVSFELNTQVKSFPEDPSNIEKLISKKEQRFQKAVTMGLVFKNDPIWLIIISGCGFDRPSYNMAFRKIVAKGINLKGCFERIFFILIERDQVVVLEL